LYFDNSISHLKPLSLIRILENLEGVQSQRLTSKELIIT